MTNEEYIERYIYAVTKRMPRKLREDVAQELSGLIADMLAARCGDAHSGSLPPTEHDVRVVLTELGRPGELAEKYGAPGGRQYLIGPGYFQGYKLLLRIVLPCVAGGLLLSFLIIALLGANEQPLHEMIFQWIGMLFSGCFFAFGGITIVFIILEWRGVDFDTGDESIDDLPPVPQKNERISRGESIFSMVMALLFCIVFLAAPGILGWYVQGGVWTPLFNVGVLRSRWLFILLFALLGLADSAFQLVDGRYTKRVAIVTTVTDLLSIPLAFAIFGDGAVINPVFVSGISALVNGEPIVVRLFENFHVLFLGVLLFAFALDIGTTVVKAVRAGKGNSQ